MWEQHTSKFGLRWGGTLYRARKNVVIKEALGFEIACFFRVSIKTSFHLISVMDFIASGHAPFLLSMGCVAAPTVLH